MIYSKPLSNVHVDVLMYYGCVNPCVLAVAVPLLCESRGGSGLGRLWPDSLVDLATADAAPSGGGARFCPRGGVIARIATAIVCKLGG